LIKKKHRTTPSYHWRQDHVKYESGLQNCRSTKKEIASSQLSSGRPFDFAHHSSVLRCMIVVLTPICSILHKGYSSYSKQWSVYLLSMRNTHCLYNYRIDKNRLNPMSRTGHDLLRFLSYFPCVLENDCIHYHSIRHHSVLRFTWWFAVYGLSWALVEKL
jgi:hypothetical protein